MDWDAEDAHPWGLGEESGILGYELYQVGPYLVLKLCVSGEPPEAGQCHL